MNSMKNYQICTYELISRLAQTSAQMQVLYLGPLQLKCSKVGHAEKSRKLKDFMLH